MSTRTLPDLARALERERQAAQKAARLAAEHAVACGLASVIPAVTEQIADRWRAQCRR
jgi:hypothetical protein